MENDEFRQDITAAAMRACRDAISSNSIPAFRRGKPLLFEVGFWGFSGAEVVCFNIQYCSILHMNSKAPN